MRRVCTIALLLLLAGFWTGAKCRPSPNALRIVEPADGVDVATFSFSVEVALDPTVYAPASLAADLNGEPLALSGGPPTYTATLSPGGALLDANVLTVSAHLLSNGMKHVKKRSFNYLPPKARARQISDPGDLITGPLGHSRLGDYLLENSVARFVVQDVLPLGPGGVSGRDYNAVGQFGGNLIDAELVGHPGIDNFMELQPALNIETVVNAQSIEIVNDGQDGTAAIVRSCGRDDILDAINPSGAAAQVGAVVPAEADDTDYEVEACTDYVLEPLVPYVELTTTVENMEATDLGHYVGDYINGGGEVEQWSPPAFPFHTGVGELLATFGNELMSFIGFRSAEGVDYAHINVPSPASSSSFTDSGVSYILHSQAVVLVLAGAPADFLIPAGGSESFTRWFSVGDGSGANAVDARLEILGASTGTLKGKVTVNGVPQAGARVVAGNRVTGQIKIVRSIFVTDANGNYEGTLLPGTYGVAASKIGVPYEGGGSTPLVHTVSITAGATITKDVNLPQTGHLSVGVVDEGGVPVPARVTVVGFDPSPEIPLQSTITSFVLRSSLFRDATKDPLPFGVVQLEYTELDGTVDFDLEPGNYQVFVSRGSEYSAYQTAITIDPGENEVVSAQIAHVIDTPDFVSSDFHVHMINSPDSRISIADRVKSFAGEGVDNIVATDHFYRTDLQSEIVALGFEDFVHATMGEEITTFDIGHFNAYPVAQDPTQVSKGAADWGLAAPPGEDFVEYGNYSATPAQIEAIALAPATGGLPNTAVQINHIDSHFGPLRIDTSVIPPESFLTPAGALAFRLDPAVTNFFHHFKALELWNGYTRSQALTEFLNQRIGIWMNLLNQGILSTAIADTDTHDYFTSRQGGARSWTASTGEGPANVDDDEVGTAVNEGRVVGGQGLYVQASIHAASTGQTADLGFGGSTLVTTSDGTATLSIDVQAPIWAEYDTIEIYRNASTVVTGTNGGTPVFFTAAPTTTLTLGGGDFTRTEVNDFPSIPDARHFETSVTLPLALAQDAWVAVVVKGTDGVSKPMFPVMPASLNSSANLDLGDLLDGNLGEDGVLALGYTNALFVDVNQDGEFDAPLAP